MVDKMHDIKIKTFGYKRKLKDLAFQAGYSYAFFSQVINQFKPVPKDFMSRIKKVLQVWDSEQKGIRGKNERKND